MSSYYIGYSTDDGIRYSSASGGVGSAVIKYLLDCKEYGTSMTFVFNRKTCQYEPRLIYDYADYNNCGSIYQDTDTVSFIKDNIQNIRDGIIITCMPCQVRILRYILNQNHIKNIIISLCCSGQTTIQGTWLYYSMLGIHKEDVETIQYRGNGWPSGIQIRLKNGEIIKKENYSYPWKLIHQSLLYRPKRCLSCTIKTCPDADVSLADPWLKEYIENDHIGNSVVICNETGEAIIQQMIRDRGLNLKKVEESTYVSSQLGTIQEKAHANRNKTFNKIVGSMGSEKSIYKKLVILSPLFLKLHLRIIRVLRRYLVKP